MNPLEELARLILSGEALSAREFVKSLTAQRLVFEIVPKPVTPDTKILALAAALASLLSSRSDQSPPGWAEEVPGISPPIHLLEAAATMKNLRRLCESSGPESLRRKGFFAPPGYLTTA